MVGYLWLVWLWYPFSDIGQNIEEPKCLTRGNKDVEELKEILSDGRYRPLKGSCLTPLKVSECIGIFLM